MTSPAIGTFKGFGVTLKQIFKKPITQQYPEYKRPLYPRFRGRHRLWRHHNGLAKHQKSVVCFGSLRRHAESDLQEADHAAVPGVQAPALPALPRAAPALATPERARE